MPLSQREQKRLLQNYGPWALITGASSGIGRELALALAQIGFHLALNARNPEQLLQVQNEVKTLNPQIQTQIIAADLSQKLGIEQVLRQCQNLPIGLFIASAGYGTSGPFIHNDLNDELNMLQLNCQALLSLTHHFGQKFAQAKRGGIILMSSIVAFQGVPQAAHYAATKAYVQTLAEALALELKPLGVSVLAAAPGPVQSGFAQRANMQMSLSLRPDQVALPILRALGRKTTVLPALLSKLLVYSLSLAPRWLKIKIMGKIMHNMTQHQTKPNPSLS